MGLKFKKVKNHWYKDGFQFHGLCIEWVTKKKEKEKKFTTWLEMEICSGIPGRWALLQRWGISLTKHWPVSHHLDLQAKVTWRACGVKTTPGEGGDVDHELTTSEFTVCASVKLWQCVWCMMVRCYILLRSELLLIPYVRVNRRSGRMLTEIYSFSPASTIVWDSRTSRRWCSVLLEHITACFHPIRRQSQLQPQSQTGEKTGCL